MDNELINNPNDSIAVYGAGTIANIYYYYAKEIGIASHIKYFVVNKMEGNPGSILGIPVVEIKKISNELQDMEIIIAVQESLQNEVIKFLKEHRCCNYSVVDSNKIMDDFITELKCNGIDRYKIIGQNQRIAGYGDNPKYIFEELHRRDLYNKLDLVWSVSAIDETIPPYVRQVIYGSYEYYKELYTAHIWIDNARKPGLIRKQDGQIYIQTWHGAAPIKKVEADAEDTLSDLYVQGAKHDSEMADLFLSGSKFYTELYRKSFWYSGKILEVGLPRQDVFWNIKDIREKTYRKLHINDQCGTVLYAPTFRKGCNENSYDLNIEHVLTALEKRFNRKFKMIVSRHPTNHTPYPFQENKSIIIVDRTQDFEELLATVDVLITDYSGCMYDFSFTGRPVFLFQNDYDTYERGFYIPMDNLPYIRAFSNDMLVDRIVNFNQERYKNKLNIFMQSMGNYDDGNASVKVVDYIIDNYLKDLK